MAWLTPLPRRRWSEAPQATGPSGSKPLSRLSSRAVCALPPAGAAPSPTRPVGESWATSSGALRLPGEHRQPQPVVGGAVEQPALAPVVRPGRLAQPLERAAAGIRLTAEQSSKNIRRGRPGPARANEVAVLVLDDVSLTHRPRSAPVPRSVAVNAVNGSSAMPKSRPNSPASSSGSNGGNSPRSRKLSLPTSSTAGRWTSYDVFVGRTSTGASTGLRRSL